MKRVWEPVILEPLGTRKSTSSEPAAGSDSPQALFEDLRDRGLEDCRWSLPALVVQSKEAAPKKSLGVFACFLLGFPESECRNQTPIRATRGFKSP